MSAHILVVDDEPDIAALVAYHLARESYRVRTASDGVEALRAIETQLPDLIVLDLMLPGLSGLDVLRELRREPEAESVPVILLTAKNDEQDRVEGLMLGADDYIAKPFSARELVLRVGAVLRRHVRPVSSESLTKPIRVGPFLVDVNAVRVEVNGRDLELTPTEFRLLQVLMERRGRVQSRRHLLESVWEVTARITTRTVDMHVQRLRGKLGEESGWIETVRGFGYRFRGEQR
ncbi:MAG: response regulator transcription factor [Gemmatimonadota bacterium]|nr:response regulator transcription factor [Gemmatimonadota bacterium]